MSAPTHHVYLVPGFFGFANLGELRYFAHVRDVLGRALDRCGVDAVIHDVPTLPTASLPKRAARLAGVVSETSAGGGPVHIVGHSTGGLDARMLVSPGVALPTDVPVAALVDRVASVVTACTPHHGTPLATFFTGMSGQRLLHLLSILTIHVLRRGPIPLDAGRRLLGVLTRLGAGRRVSPRVLDQIAAQLLQDFTPDRRRALSEFFAHVAQDRGLMTQLTPEGADVLNATLRDPEHVRCGSVVTRTRRPGLRDTASLGFDAYAQTLHAVFRALQVLSSGPAGWAAEHVTPTWRETLARAYGDPPDVRSSDGIVPTLSQPWGEIIHAAWGDHLDVCGHFDAPQDHPPHFDWLPSGSAFDRAGFERLWGDVAAFQATAAGH